MTSKRTAVQGPARLDSGTAQAGPLSVKHSDAITAPGIDVVAGVTPMWYRHTRRLTSQAERPPI